MGLELPSHLLDRDLVQSFKLFYLFRAIKDLFRFPSSVLVAHVFPFAIVKFFSLSVQIQLL